MIFLSLGVLCILVRENDRMPPEDKRVCYLTYILIACSALAEWLGTQLNGRAELPSWPLRVVKCADFVLTPLVGVAFVSQLKLRNRWYSLMRGVLIFNTVFQVVSIFTGWSVTIDSQNHYDHGPLYFVYICVYLAIIAMTVLEFILYGRAYRRQNKFSVYAVLVLIGAGIGIQEVFGREYRTAYLALTFGAMLMFIHYSEFIQMASDDHIQEQQILITTDALTGALSRHAYSKALRDLDAAGTLPLDLVVFSIDINGLKTVNDTLGHAAGDELICGAARCIDGVLGRWGKCYRTGGDEFVVLTYMERADAVHALSQLSRQAVKWHGKAARELHLAAGFAAAADHSGLSSETLVSMADKAMYSEKASFYRRTGNDRRARSYI